MNQNKSLPEAKNNCPLVHRITLLVMGLYIITVITLLTFNTFFIALTL